MGVKASRPLYKLQLYDGSASLDTFLMKFRGMADYLQWDKEDTFHHLCASLEGAAGPVLWNAGPRATTADIVGLLQTRVGMQLQVERFKAELHVRWRAHTREVESSR